MLQIIGASITILLISSLAGFPLTQMIIGRTTSNLYLRFPVILMLSILFGFFISAISSTISYGVIGIDHYPLVFSVISAFLWLFILYAIKKQSINLKKIKFEKSDLSLLFILIWCLVLTRTQWDTIVKPKLVSGDGPDTSQNLMAALSARSLGDTWAEQAEKINSFFGSSSLRQTVYEIYRYPSFQEQAGFDYLVFGTRWGLSVPYSQVLRFFGNQAVLWETGIIVTTSLLILALMMYGICVLLETPTFAAFTISLIAVSNSLLLVQYFNGGLSQVWSIPGLLGVSLILLLVVCKNKTNLLLSYKSLMVISTASWTILLATYVDTAVILGLLTIITCLLFMFVDKQNTLKLFGILASGGLIALLINPVLTFATLFTFDLRMRAASGTGLPSNFWAFPSEILGFVDVFSNTNNRSPETAIVGVLLSTAIFLTFVKKEKNRQMMSNRQILGMSCLLTMLIGFFLSYTGKLQTSYIYNKVSIYVVPILLILWISSFKIPTQESAVKSGKFTKKMPSIKVTSLGYMSILISLSFIALTSSYSATNNLSRQGTSIPYDFSTLLMNKDLQEKMTQFNYLTPYILSANYLGVIANVHWVSKAPNDIKLDSRLDLEMRLICFSRDLNCKPSTQRIVDLELESFGIFQYESPISTREFAALSARDRYKANFEVFGLEPQPIPERFIGGNPYYN